MGVFRMPSLGSDMEDGTLVEWLVAPGDAVKRGDVVAVVETQKGAIEIETFEPGRIGRLIAAIGDVLPVGAPMAEIETPAEAAAATAEAPRRPSAPPPEPAAAPTEAHRAPAPAPSAAAPTPAGAPQAPGDAPRAPSGAPRTPGDAPPGAADAPADARRAPFGAPRTPADAPPGPADAPAGAPAETPPPPAGAVVPASPAARRAAEAAGLDLAAIPGSGPGGAVRLPDVERAAAPAAAPAAPEPAPREAPARRFDPAAMREAIAAAMTRSKREAPHFYLFHRIDLTPTADRLAEINAERPPETRLALGLLLVRAAARAARDVPGLNGVWENGIFQPSQAVHPGVAVSLRGGGLVAPALRDAAEAPLDDLMAGLRDLVARARTGRLRASELSAPTITVSSLGERGVDALLGVIFPPQAALVGFGTPARRPWVMGEEIRPRLIVEASLSADHRVADGRLGARFLAALEDHLATPETP